MPHDAHSGFRDKVWLSTMLVGFTFIFFNPWLANFFTPDTAEQLLTSAPTQSSRWRENFSVYFISIALEAAPFMILGTLVSALIERFVPAGFLPRMAQKLGILGIPAMVLAAPLFPICECGVVPVARRLLKKGLPLSHTIAYLLAAPIFNPVVLMGTWLAFFKDPIYPFLRGLGGISVAIFVALLFLRYRDALRPGAIRVDRPGEIPIHSHQAQKPKRFGLASLMSIWRDLAYHVRHDFLEIAPYFLFGVFVASCMKTFIPQGMLFQWGGEPVLGPALMMVAAFVMSLCSEADAFLAASFVEFDVIGHMAFLVLGPMLDIKLILMYSAIFKARFIALFSLAITVGVVLYLIFIDKILWDKMDMIMGGVPL
nr:permease [Candidatus Magnetococcus massalia]CRH08257.1 Permease [Candidatus Magnetococcus massalia]